MSARPTYHHGDLPAALRSAALDELRARGPGGFRLRAVAREVGVDVAAVYRHFDDKDDLLRAVAVDGFHALGAALDAAAALEPEPAARLAAVGVAYVGFAQADPQRFRLMFGPAGAGAPGPLCADGPTRAWAALQEPLADLHAAGRLRAPLAEAALTAWSAVHGLATLRVDGAVVDGAGPAGGAPARAVVDGVLRGLVAPSVAREDDRG